MPDSQSPSKRPLTRAELRDLVTRLAADEASWRPLVRHEEDRRVYVELQGDDNVGIWLICWMNDHDTGFHDHDISNGAVAVVQGEVREERLAVGGEAPSTVYRGGDSFDFASSDIHRMSHAGGGPAVSIHVYSPPLDRMGAYAVNPAGVLQRTAISYEEELRPIEAAA